MQLLRQRAAYLLRENPQVKTAFERLGIAAASMTTLDAAGFVEVIAAQGYRTAMVDGFRRFSLEDPFPINEAFRSNADVWIETHEEFVERFVASAAAFTDGDRRGWACVPFRVRGDVRCVFAASFLARQALHPALRAEVADFVKWLALELEPPTV